LKRKELKWITYFQAFAIKVNSEFLQHPYNSSQ
jgi:hypothetical protein